MLNFFLCYLFTSQCFYVIQLVSDRANTCGEAKNESSGSVDSGWSQSFKGLHTQTYQDMDNCHIHRVRPLLNKSQSEEPYLGSGDGLDCCSVVHSPLFR